MAVRLIEMDFRVEWNDNGHHDVVKCDVRAVLRPASWPESTWEELRLSFRPQTGADYDIAAILLKETIAQAKRAVEIAEESK